MGMLLNHIAKIEAVHKHEFWLRFRDNQLLYLNLADIAEIAQRATGGYLEPFKDPAYFEQVSIDYYGALVWSTGYDMCPDYLYMRGQTVSESEIPQFKKAS